MMRVLDATRTLAGGYCAEMLRLIGADVVRVEVAAGPLPAVEEDALARQYVNRGKTLLPGTIDLDADRAALLSLLADADCLVEDWGPGRLDALGLGEDVLRERAPALVLTRVSEFGQDGPWAGWAGSELVNLAAGGMLFLTGTWDRPPVQLAPFQAQLTAGLLAAVAAASALFGGGPATIDLSKQEAVLALVTPAPTEYLYSGTIPAREAQVAPMARIERASDDWVYVGPGAAVNADYQRYAAFLGIPEFAEPRFATPDGRMEHWDEHQRLLQARLLERTAREWVDGAAEARLTFGHVQSTTDLLNSEVLAERGFFAETTIDGRPARAPLAPYLVDGARPTTLAEPAAAEPISSTDNRAEDAMAIAPLPVLNEENAPPGTPLRPYSASYSAETIREYLERTGESPDAYVLDGVQCVPPVILLACYLRLIHESFFYETGVHVTSDLTVRRLPRQDEPVNVTGAVLDNYERNGSKYVKFSVNVAAEDGERLVDIEHLSIYKLRPRSERA